MLAYYTVSPLEAGGLDEFAFTYESEVKLPIGQVVSVPFGRRKSLGIVIASVGKPSFATKAIQEVLEITLPAYQVELAKWLFTYYVASPQAIWQTLLPAGLTRKRRTTRAQKHELNIDSKPVTLTAKQQAVLREIGSDEHRTHLLHGVTGSGKTEIYLELAKSAIANGKSVVVLVPEIALVPQLDARFRAVFANLVVSQHSKQTEAQRHNAWATILNAEGPRIVIGPRSSLFLPLANPGLVIVDEAHETSYKQEQAPRYQTTTVAAKIAQLVDAKLLLGTATPTLEQRYLANTKRIGYSELPERPDGGAMPQSRIIDLREKEQFARSRFISTPLLDQIQSNLANGRQSLLFINRRGSAASQICGDCGTVNLCPNCQLPLTFHADQLKLICHYCNFHKAPQAVCENCGSGNLRYLGGGTKRVEEEIHRLLPDARLARLDKDSATPAYIHEVHDGLHKGSIDILIGTQMIAKGLDLPNLDLVGVISADTMLHLPDYTAAERTFQLIHQVSGRAGRRERQGEVIIQSYTPSHPAIVAAASHHEIEFTEAELATRRLLGYPPFSFLLKLTCQMSTQAKASAKAHELAENIRKQPELIVVGPAPSFIEQAGGSFHWQLIVKAKDRKRLVDVARNLPSGWTIDLDPGNLL